ncbi:MAG: hypothetical protein WCG42_09510 [Parachlamydiaceae bacterium]
MNSIYSEHNFNRTPSYVVSKDLNGVVDVLKNNFHLHLDEIGKGLGFDHVDLDLEITDPLDRQCEIKSSKLLICPLFLLPNLELMPIELRPVNSMDPRLDTQEYWHEVSNWLSTIFSLTPKVESDVDIQDIQVLKHTLLLLANDPGIVVDNIKNHLATDIKRFVHRKNLSDKIRLTMKEIHFEKIDETSIYFSKPIDPTMAWANTSSISVCPLIVINLDKIPEDLRPIDSNDPKLYDLKFLQRLSDWLAEEYEIDKQTVGIMEIAAIKTILKLRENFLGQKALRAGLVHELGHIALKHPEKQRKHRLEASRSTTVWGKAIRILTGGIVQKVLVFAKMIVQIKEYEREADLYAVNHLNDGVEGIRIGFATWRESLKEVRACKTLKWKDKVFAKLFITPKGNFWPLVFTHGSFKDRIERAEAAVKVKEEKRSNS